MAFSQLSKITRSLLWRTNIGRLTAAKYWKIRKEGPGFRYVYQRIEDVFSGIPVNFSDATFSEFIAKDSEEWKFQKEFVLEIEDVLLEPERLLGTRASRDLVEQTVVYKIDRQYPYIISHLLRPSHPTELATAIWYDGSATRNYYHHFVDALSCLQQWERSGLPLNTPVLITRQMFETVYFQFLYKRSAYMQQLNWYVVGNDEWIRVKKLYKFQSAHFSARSWQNMREIYALPNRKPWRKVFLNRDRRRYGRYLSNEEEVKSMLKRHGFEEVFAENLSIEQQAQLFQETKYLVALTGAGLIQQFFMTYEYGHVIEIMPLNRLMPEYYWQAYTLGMHYYDVVVGGNMDAGKDYPVDLAKLEAAVARMLHAQPQGQIYGLTTLQSVGVTD